MKDELISPRRQGNAADGQPPYDASPPSYVCPPIRGDIDMRGRCHISPKLTIASFRVFPHVANALAGVATPKILWALALWFADFSVTLRHEKLFLP